MQIVDYKPACREAFRTLNEEWISTWFKMEEADHKALDDPKGYILNKGGRILVALYEGEPVGVCALIKMKDLSSMTLNSPRWRCLRMHRVKILAGCWGMR